MANLQTEFSLEDIEIARNVRSTLHCGLCRIALNAPDQVFRVGTSDITGKYETGMARITYRTLKLQYAINVWHHAIVISHKNPGPLVDLCWLNWENRPNGYRVLVYGKYLQSNEEAQQHLIDEFLSLLQQVADSGDITVHEYCFSDLNTSCEPFYDVVVDGSTAHDICDRIGPIADYSYNKADVSYSWEDIKDFFIVLTLNQLRLVNRGGLHEQSLWDEVMFKGASDCNIPMIQYALDHGANIQSFDTLSESALTRALDEAQYPEEDYDIDKVKETIDFLLSKGADIDAFGCDGTPPLMAAYYARSPELVKFLIDRGANVNFNCYLLDNQYWPHLKQIKSTLLDSIDELLCEDYIPEVIEIEKMVKAAGGEQNYPTEERLTGDVDESDTDKAP